jgi:low temperature requirement protein LtrA
VVAVFEIATNIVISSNWKAVTFKGTHLVQRMSLLTLIILGEGVMTIVEKITTARRFL